jgi:hypothetical protein
VEAFWGFLDLREHAGKDLKAQVLLIAQAIGTALKDADFVVKPLDKAERDLVLGTAVGGDAIPVAIDHRSKLLVGFEPPKVIMTARSRGVSVAAATASTKLSGTFRCRGKSEERFPTSPTPDSLMTLPQPAA